MSGSHATIGWFWSEREKWRVCFPSLMLQLTGEIWFSGFQGVKKSGFIFLLRKLPGGSPWLQGILSCMGSWIVAAGNPFQSGGWWRSIYPGRGAAIELELGYYPYPEYEPMAFWGDEREIGKTDDCSSLFWLRIITYYCLYSPMEQHDSSELSVEKHIFVRWKEERVHPGYQKGQKRSTHVTLHSEARTREADTLFSCLRSFLHQTCRR